MLLRRSLPYCMCFFSVRTTIAITSNYFLTVVVYSLSLLLIQYVFFSIVMYYSATDILVRSVFSSYVLLLIFQSNLYIISSRLLTRAIIEEDILKF